MDNDTTLPQSLLCEDIEEEILSRLPVKSLLRFRCVSKPWRSLIDGNRFIQKHLQNYSNNQTYENRRVIMRCKRHGLKQHGPNPSSWISFFDQPFLHLTRIDDPKNKHLMSGIAVGSCNGLFCICKVSKQRYFLWNPATRISIELPKLEFPKIPLTIRKWGFGWDEESSAYKVFVGLSDRHGRGIGRVYSSKTNSWKSAQKLGNISSLCNPYGKVACGKIHWLTKSGHIEAFDLKSEVFGTMEQPCKPEEDGSNLFLMESRGFLRVGYVNFKDNDNERITVWMMKDYGVKESWVEEISPQVKMVAGCCRPVVYVESLVSPLLAKEALCSTTTRELNILKRLMVKFGLKRRDKKTH